MYIDIQERSKLGYCTSSFAIESLNILCVHLASFADLHVNSVC